MSDKSFGDHLNRNIVKNPLLSSAVTGLSIEDLTHNAVLLPVAPSQELITRQDQKVGPQSVTLAQPDSKYESLLSGDANSNILHTNYPPTSKEKYYDNQENIKNILNQQLSQSKASSKPDDDFDVNEYYARLQGTRYVSAPLNSLLKEDQKASLEATEENLEEINLNEPDKAQHVETQQSLTADIAQNFSQLPTVLPQVASAVFSSFSNMLSMKSREQTPDEARTKPLGHQEVNIQRSEELNVPLTTVDEPVIPKEVAPPPTQPPIGGTNYRITTRKKAYAQIPGLSSTHQPLNPTNTAPYYQTDYSNMMPQHQVNISGVQSTESKIQPADTIAHVQAFSIFNPGPADDNTQPNPSVINTEPNVLESNKSFSAAIAPNIKKEATVFKTVESNEQVTNLNVTNTSIIPPPPMFSNSPKKDGQSNLKSVLPPSVARRIGSNHPIIKPQTLLTVVPTDNIFVPTPGPDVAADSFAESRAPFPLQANLPSKEEKSATGSQSAFVQFNTPTANRESSPVSLLTDTTTKPPPVDATINLALTQPTQFIPQPDNKLLSNIPSFSSQAESSSNYYASPYASQQATVPPPIMYNPNDVPSSIPLLKSPEVLAPQPLPIEKHPPINQPPMPSFFDPLPNITEPKVDMLGINSLSGGNVDQNATIETPKPLPEPPKLTGSVSYRMTKKRPQYYAGPIEGVGAISNNVKPTIAALEPSTFQGAVFTPDIQGAVITPDISATVEQAASTIPAFDINQHSVAQPAASYSQLEINQPLTQNYAAPQYNTAFDMSRQTTDNFEPPKQESRGFGIIGSLKSKLSSLDINKIQNSVTTFFDPTYNDTKRDTSNEGNVGYNAFNYQDGSLEVFVPNVEQNKQMEGQTYEQYNYQNAYNYGQDSYQMPTNDYGNGMQAYGSQSYFTDSNYAPNPQPQIPDASNIHAEYSTSFFNTQLPVKDTYNPYTSSTPEQAETAIPSHSYPTDIVESSPYIIEEQKRTEYKGTEEKNLQPETAQSVQILNQANGPPHKNETNPILTDSSAISFFDNQQIFSLSQPIYSDELHKKLENLNITQEIQKEPSPNNNVFYDKIKSDVFSNSSEISTPIDVQIASRLGTDFFRDLTPQPKYLDSLQSPSDYFGSKGIEELDRFDTNDSIIGNCSLDSISNDGIMDDIPRLDAPTILFGLPSIPPTHIGEIDNNIESVPLYEPPPVEIPTDDADFFDNIIDESKPLSKKCESHSELNICETCREFHKHEDKEVDDLTTQLIDNITSPIQLSNPVVAELTESGTPNEERTDFDSQQCDEITHITEETIETIQVQSAAELLDDVDELNNINVRNYGWVAEEPAYSQTTALVDHDYSFQIDPNAIGFYGNNSMFFENMPTNASDEIKAEFQGSQDEAPVVLQSQMSIPSAPPVEDDDDGKSDETGILDVHSIEQDAKKDFPIFEEFVIEPSETDDDKIEYRERERSSDDPAQDIDTFTNRVERFKKMEEFVDKSDDALGSQKNLLFDLSDTNPAISIASYFDTGNYAAETHYRNSMSSPSMPFQAGSTNVPFSIPPGFEDEYKRRLSAMALQDDKKSDKDDNIPYIPDTSTQTRPVVTTTYGGVSSIRPSMTVASAINLSAQPAETITETQKLPEFSAVFGHQPESGDSLTSSLFAKVEDHPAAIFHEPKISKEPTKPLEDPISFFTDKGDTLKVESSDSGFNRLASYFAAPTKNEPSKPFFELSQSQNHYRHANTTISFDSGVRNINKACKNNNPAQTSTLQNIPTDVYLANLSLMNDLTSTQNVTFKPNDQIVRTINYFTIEYDNNIDINKDAGRIRCVGKENLDESSVTVDNNSSDDTSDATVVSKCHFCCNNDFHRVTALNKVDIKSDFKVRKTMDSGKDSSSDNRADRRSDMDQRPQDGSRDVTVNFGNGLEEDSERVAVMPKNRLSSAEYTPVKHHWFYRVDFEEKSIWRGFSTTDNKALEDAFHSPDLDENTVVATDGGRYDVNIIGRLRTPVYWSDKPTNVWRCSWFYKGTTDARYVPYTEAVAEKLEEEYRHGITTGEWHRRLVLPSGELVVLHGPAVMVHLAHAPDALTAQPLFGFAKRVYRNPPKTRFARDQPRTVDHLLLLVHGAGEYRTRKEKEVQSTMRPRVVRRGCDETEIEDAEPSSIDHLLLLCHGVGSACDMRFRSVEEVVDDFRATSLQLVQSHYRNSCDQGVVNRVEVLPISWHATLHSGETGVDKRLSAITLDSIPRLRNFTNDTVLDVLFYTSPVFCQTIIDTVCAELNRIYHMFMARNPGFTGRVSLGGHSLGSVILYDLLCHQHPGLAPEPQFPGKKYVQGAAGTGQAAVRYPALDFKPAALYALGSPIAMFECIRGVKSLGTDFCLPTCENFFNIFHPYDPIAYRIEPLINAQLGRCKPFLIPHHKGRKRMHLELKDTMARVGADLKQKLLESLKSTWSSMWKTQPPNDTQLEKVVEEEMEKEGLCEEVKEETPQSDDFATPEAMGALNAGRRVDYVLQEAPFEMINEYLFAMSSHVCYWESEDTMLLILKEIYESLGVRPDSTVPQQSMTVQRTRNTGELVNATSTDIPSTSRDST